MTRKHENCSRDIPLVDVIIKCALRKDDEIWSSLFTGVASMLRTDPRIIEKSNYNFE